MARIGRSRPVSHYVKIADGLSRVAVTFPDVGATASSISFVSESHSWSDSASASSWTLNNPAGTQAGDLLIGFYQTGAVQTYITPPAGWVSVRNVILDSVDADIGVNVCYRIVQSGDPSSWTDGTQSANSARRLSVTVAYRGVNTLTPFVVENGLSTDTDATTIATPTVTNDRDTAWCVTAFAASRADGTDFSWTSDDGIERAENNMPSATFEPSLQVGDSNGTISAGSTSRTGTVTQAFDSAVAWIGILRPLYAATEAPVVAYGPSSFDVTGIPTTADASATAYDPNPDLLVNAEEPEVAVTAYDPTVVTEVHTDAPAGLADVTVTAYDAASIDIAVSAESPAVASAASDSTTAVVCNAGEPEVAAQAFDASTSINAQPDAPAVASAAFDPTTQIVVNAETTTVTGAANDPTTAIQVFPDAPEVTTTAYDPTVSTSSDVLANAEEPEVTAAANAPTTIVTVEGTETTTVTTAANDPTTAITANAETTTVAADAQTPTPDIAVFPTQPSVTAGALDAMTSQTTTPDTSTAAGNANDPNAAVSINAETISVTVSAFTPTPSPVAQAEQIIVAALANDAMAVLTVLAEAASVVVAAFDATVELTGVDILAPAGLATVGVSAFDATVSLVVPTPSGRTVHIPAESRRI